MVHAILALEMISHGLSSAPFRGDVDLEKLLTEVPPHHAIKGAFIASSVAIVTNDWERIQPRLTAPPRGGRYVAFKDYPLSDFLRVSDAAARVQFPGIGTREGHRRLARHVIEIFGQTVLGRVSLNLVSGPASLLESYEGIFNQMMKGARVRTKVVGPQAVDLQYTDYYATCEAIFGVLEGSVLACKFEPTVKVEANGQARYTAHVTWETL